MQRNRVRYTHCSEIHMWMNYWEIELYQIWVLLQHATMLHAVIAIAFLSVCLSVSVTRWYCVKMNEHLHWQLAQLSSFCQYKVHKHIYKGSPLARVLNETGYVPEAIFTMQLHVMQRTVLQSQFGLSVRLSVRRVYCDKTKWWIADILIPHETAITVVLWHQHWLEGDTPFPLKSLLKVTHPLQKMPT